MPRIPDIEHLANLIERNIQERQLPSTLANDSSSPVTWSDLLPDLQKQLAITRIRAGSQRARERYQRLDERDPQAIAQVLYQFGECHHFAAAVAERYGLKDQIWHVITGALPEGHRHVVVKAGPDQFLDYSGLHTESELTRRYSDATWRIDAELIQDRYLNPRPEENPAAFELALRVLIQRENASDFGIRPPGG